HEAMRNMIQEYHLEDVKYLIGIDSSKIPARYVLFTNIPRPLFAEMESKLDWELSRLNEIYAALRKKEFIAMPEVIYFLDFEKYKTNFKPKLFLTLEEVLEMKESL
ncbi:MAG: hypothetical protein K2H02_05705, partial [Anaeroplasmataceae bacterium]|nr:hypothetical protein [Anaeroplasmataceae bacterium]